MADNNKFQEFMNSLLNIKVIAIIAVAGAVFAALVNFLKTANEGYNIIFKKEDGNIKAATSQVVNKYENMKFEINDSLTVKGTVDFFTLISALAVDSVGADGMDTEGSTTDWYAEADNPHINWVTDGFDYDGDTTDAFDACGGNKSRTGYCIITSYDEPLYSILSKRIEPGAWMIKYCGPEFGATSVYISSVDVGEGLGVGLVELALEGRAKVSKIEETGDSTSYPGEHYITYIVSIPKKRDIRITEYASCGAHMGSISYRLQA